MYRRILKISMYSIAGLFIAFVIAAFVMPRKNTCGFSDNRVTIATVTFGPFYQYIPQTGTVLLDSTDSSTYKVRADIDEYYLSQIHPGLLASTTFDNSDYDLEIIKVFPEVTNGHFKIDLKFKGEAPLASEGKTARLRITINESENRLLLPTGGFYKDTRGKWIYILADHNHAVKREIKLGRKMGSEYYEVLDGLKVGDRVITSSYEKFLSEDEIDLADYNN